MEVLELAPAMVLVLMKTSPEAIRQRMHEHPRTKSLFQAKDAEYVLGRFQEEYDKSLIDRRFSLDTTGVTVEQTLQEFIEKMRPLLTKRDQLRIISQEMTKAVAAAKGK